VTVEPIRRHHRRLFGDLRGTDRRTHREPCSRRRACAAAPTLLDHIAMSQKFMPGVVMTRAGDVPQCQGTALVEWAAADAAGAVRGKGVNVVRFAADGRIAAVVGFW
jgi:hypothetical protein